MWNGPIFEQRRSVCVLIHFLRLKTLFDVCRFCNDISGFTSNIGNLCLLSFLSVSLEVCLFHWSFQRAISLFYWFFSIVCFHCHRFLLLSSLFPLFAWFVLFYPSFSNFLSWELRLIWDFYSFQMFALKGIICPLSTFLAVSYKFWNTVHSVQCIFKNFPETSPLTHVWSGRVLCSFQAFGYFLIF